jgi:hypothetical protein
MSRNTTARLGLLGILIIGFALGYMVADKGTAPLPPATAAESQPDKPTSGTAGMTFLPDASPTKPRSVGGGTQNRSPIENLYLQPFPNDFGVT